MKIGIIGYGYVGSAIGQAHQHDDVIVYDPVLSNNITIEDLIDCDAIYVCVPSPQGNTGQCDSSILESTIDTLLPQLLQAKNHIPVICKTTAPPRVYESISTEYPMVVHSPEFLTAANNITDYYYSNYVVIGGSVMWSDVAKRIINRGLQLPPDRFICTDIKSAALYKYMINSYLATKVTFMNEFKSLATAYGIDWNTFKELSIHDPRIGQSHMDVPGPDGQFGWGGGCFPKDINAIIKEAIDLNIDFELLDRITTINQKHRRNK